MDNPNKKPQRGLKAGFLKPGVKEIQHRINNKIFATTVRVVGENVIPGIYSLSEAMRMANEAGLDLVEISSNAVPPVCHIAEYSKVLFELKKKTKPGKSSKVKELQFGPHMGDHDYQVRKNQAIEFLQKGWKVKAVLTFKGREMAYKDKGEILLLKFVTELSEVGKAEQIPKLDGKKMLVMIAPKKRN